jgi:hypothetical protein
MIQEFILSLEIMPKIKEVNFSAISNPSVIIYFIISSTKEMRQLFTIKKENWINHSLSIISVVFAHGIKIAYTIGKLLLTLL